MAKSTTRFTCQQCGYVTQKWVGKCPSCNEWNTIVEEIVAVESRTVKHQSVSFTPPVSVLEVMAEIDDRISTGSIELDRVLGGGIVPAALMLIGGDPGIGKSTLLTQTAGYVAENYGTCLYVSGEESVRQIKMRADRLGTLSKNFLIASETELGSILSAIKHTNPKLIIIDSIQTTYDSQLESAPATVSQVRACAGILQRVAKEDGIPVFLVGHVTKDGSIAGPRVLEHLVDTVLYFEGEQQGAFRMLRAVKNRFGSSDEVGMFEMRENGLAQVDNPSAALLSERNSESPGSVVMSSIEGTRALLVEVQALCAPSYLNNPRRVFSGVDYNRVSMVIAIMEKRLGFRLGNRDVFVNIAGGAKIVEPAMDLALILAMASSYRDAPIDPGMVVFGEVGLGGEVRAVRNVERRLREAERLGFQKALLPKSASKTLSGNYTIEPIFASTARQALYLALPFHKAGDEPLEPEPFED